MIVFYGGVLVVDVIIIDYLLHHYHWVNELLNKNVDTTDSGGDQETGSRQSLRGSKRKLSIIKVQQ